MKASENPFNDCCPVCGRSGSVVRDSRFMPGYPTWRRRRRTCPHIECGHRWFTIEVPEHTFIAGRTTMANLTRVVDRMIHELTEIKSRLILETDTATSKIDRNELHSALTEMERYDE